MKERVSREEKMSAIAKKLEDGVREIYSSEKYKKYISAMSKFPNYSVNNCVLIATQMPEASLVCGYKKWQTDFNRTVNKGEHGLMILAPIKTKTEVEEFVYEESGKAVFDDNGNQKTEKVMKECQIFRPVYVFDISQTSGDPVPSLASELKENVDSFDDLRDVLISVSPVSVSFEKIRGSANGYFSPSSKKIVIEESLPQLQMIKTMIHEIAHPTRGHGSKEDKDSRNAKEVQAESVAYWVSQMLGLDTSDYSFGYISGWSKDKEVSELKDNLEKIKEAADKISSDIESRLMELRNKKEALPKVSEHEEGYKAVRHKKR